MQTEIVEQPIHVPTTANGTIVMPGYRFANAENPAVTNRNKPTPEAGTVSYKIPVPTPMGWQPVPNVQR